MPRALGSARAASSGERLAASGTRNWGGRRRIRSTSSTQPRSRIQGRRRGGRPVAYIVPGRAARVIDAQRRFAARQRNFAHRERGRRRARRRPCANSETPHRSRLVRQASPAPAWQWPYWTSLLPTETPARGRPCVRRVNDGGGSARQVAALPPPVSTGSGSKGVFSIPMSGYPWRLHAHYSMRAADAARVVVSSLPHESRFKMKHFR